MRSLLSIQSLQYNLRDEIAKTINVDQTGQGDFNSVQQAIDSIPPNNDQWIRIHVTAGIYNEKVVIPKEKPFILLDGEGSSTTVIQFNDFGNSINSSTFQLWAENFVAKGIMFKNTYNLVIPRGSDGNKILPAPATLIAADMDCTINATTGVLGGISGYITAQGRTSMDDNSGYVFDSCNVMGTGPVYLGRAYRRYSRVVFYKSYMYDSIVPEGWSSWSYAGQE
ncbi:hypothetical protein QYF36_017731 [Acer negundo]|nr:hypothetical protein QYF36_017731 [Acer negundo]